VCKRTSRQIGHDCGGLNWLESQTIVYFFLFTLKNINHLLRWSQLKCKSLIFLRYMPLGLRSDNGKNIYWKLVRYCLWVDRARKRYCLWVDRARLRYCLRVDRATEIRYCLRTESVEKWSPDFKSSIPILNIINSYRYSSSCCISVERKKALSHLMIRTYFFYRFDCSFVRSLPTTDAIPPSLVFE
jgi:hypothetical protein